MKGRNCPNCGAPIDLEKNKCEYCGTSYFDLSCIPLNEPFFLRVNIGTRENPKFISQKVYSSGCTLTQEPCHICYRGVVSHESQMTYEFTFIGMDGYYKVESE